MNATNTVILGLVVLFFIVRRARSLVVRQKIRPPWMLARLAIFAVLGLLVLVLAAGDLPALLADLAGLAVGLAVAALGFRLTTFEFLADGTYYTPNKYVGLAVFALFLLRLIYRLATTVAPTSNGPLPASPSANALAQFTADPLTTAVYFVLIGYYAGYYTALLLRARPGAQVL